MGECIITATTNEGGHQAHCNVSVIAEAIPVESIVLNSNSEMLAVNDSIQLTVTISPSNATNQQINWSSSNQEVAKVSNIGMVKGCGVGEAIIYATTPDGLLEQTCQVEVYGEGSVIEIMAKGTTKATVFGVDLAIDKEGLVYMAMNIPQQSAQSHANTEVWKYSGSGITWNQFGGSRVAICDDESEAPSLAISNEGSVFVSTEFYEDINDTRYEANVVFYSNGEGWTCMGNATTNALIRNGSTKLNQASELALKDDGTLLIANMFYGDGYVHYWDDNSWKSYNKYKTDSENFWGGAIEIECVGNKPFVAIVTGSGEGRSGVLTADEQSGKEEQWQWLGGSYAFSQGVGLVPFNELALTHNSAGDIFTAAKIYNDGDWSARVKRFASNADSWESVGAISCGNQNQVDVVSSNNILYLLISYSDGIRIYKQHATNLWIHEVTTPQINQAGLYHFDAISGRNGEIFIGYVITENGVDKGKIGAFKYEPYR